MREIKFRAWFPSENRMTESKTLHELCSRAAKRQHGLQDELIIMQFTGLKDKNGKEIYEGDVMGGYPHGEVVVEWDSNFACFSCFDPKTSEDYGLFGNNFESCKKEWEVIGNIHETPELL